MKYIQNIVIEFNELAQKNKKMKDRIISIIKNLA